MIKLYNDSDIFIDLESRKIIVKRGYWNFDQTTLDFSDLDENESNNLIEIFKILKNKKKINKNKIKAYKSEFDHLIAEKFVCDEDDETKLSENNVLFITDLSDLVSMKFNKYDNIFIKSIDDFNTIYFNDLDSLTQNPILINKTRNKLKNYIKQGDITCIFVVLSRVRNDFCNMINHLLDEKIVYSFIDNEYMYLFGTNKKYTGCYSCFSKRMDAKMKEEQNRYPAEKNMHENEFQDDTYLLDFIFALIEYNYVEYTKNGLLPIMGRLCSIFVKNLEIKYENLLRSVFCDECGYVSLMENRERNLQLKNFLRDL
ncbi:MAG: hypothetical protein LBB45_08365 [Methanobrevibacter sp.]|jgi:hypothetical protein|nr:hypothetical protein [Candidatus Methanovirga basalitermitum]